MHESTLASLCAFPDQLEQLYAAFADSDVNWAPHLAGLHWLLGQLCLRPVQA